MTESVAVNVHLITALRTGRGIPHLEYSVRSTAGLHAAKAFIHRILGGKCVHCGVKSGYVEWFDSVEAEHKRMPKNMMGYMHLHHRSVKHEALGNYVSMRDVPALLVKNIDGQKKLWMAFLEKIKDVELLCATCHRVIHNVSLTR